jgi:hypothetical protein
MIVPSSAITLKRTVSKETCQGLIEREVKTWGTQRVVKGSPRALRMLVKYTVPAPSQGDESDTSAPRINTRATGGRG